jgi:hypothetical protein
VVIVLIGKSRIAPKLQPGAFLPITNFSVQSGCTFRFLSEMTISYTLSQNAAAERIELYCRAHPGSPSAVRRPRLIHRSGSWTALLGNNVQDGIAGSGSTVEAALNAFDAAYLNWIRPPIESQRVA